MTRNVGSQKRLQRMRGCARRTSNCVSASSIPAAKQARLNASFGSILSPEASDAPTSDEQAGLFASVLPRVMRGRSAYGSRATIEGLRLHFRFSSRRGRFGTACEDGYPNRVHLHASGAVRAIHGVYA